MTNENFETAKEIKGNLDRLALARERVQQMDLDISLPLIVQEEQARLDKTLTDLRASITKIIDDKVSELNKKFSSL